MASVAPGITEEDRAFMEEALDLAEHAYDLREVPIGCLMVRDGKVLVRAHNKTNEEGDPTLHAEMLAVDQYVEQVQALIERKDISGLNDIFRPSERLESHDEAVPASKRVGTDVLSPSPLTDKPFPLEDIKDVRDIPPHILLRNVTLYVTIEPCVMCASALSSLGLRRCVFGASNPKFGGCGSILSVPRVASPPWCHFQTEHGLYAAEAVSLLQRFFARENPETRQRK